MENKDKIILDLCGGTGSWSRRRVRILHQAVPDGLQKKTGTEEQSTVWVY